MNWLKRFLTEPVGEPPDVSLPEAAFTGPRAASGPTYRFTDDAVRIAAVGDLHGRVDLLNRLAPEFNKAAQDTSKSFIEVYLGDYVDRGANPRAVIDFLIARRQLSDRKVICLAGNHEQMLVAALENDDEFRTWFGFGGQSTLMSYGISPVDALRNVKATRAAFNKAVPAAHVEFLASLSLSYEHGGFFFVHAGVRPGVALDAQDARDLLWIREPFLNTQANLGATVVHGHTPGSATVFRPNRIGIDTGAYRTGVLTSLLVTSQAVTVLDTTQIRSSGPVFR